MLNNNLCGGGGGDGESKNEAADWPEAEFAGRNPSNPVEDITNLPLMSVRL